MELADLLGRHLLGGLQVVDQLLAVARCGGGVALALVGGVAGAVEELRQAASVATRDVGVTGVGGELGALAGLVALGGGDLGLGVADLDVELGLAGLGRFPGARVGVDLGLQRVELRGDLLGPGLDVADGVTVGRGRREERCADEGHQQRGHCEATPDESELHGRGGYRLRSVITST